MTSLAAHLAAGDWSERVEAEHRAGRADSLIQDLPGRCPVGSGKKRFRTFFVGQVGAAKQFWLIAAFDWVVGEVDDGTGAGSAADPPKTFRVLRKMTASGLSIMAGSPGYILSDVI